MLVFLHAALGLMLGLLSPAWGIAVLVGGVAVTSSLWWQLGLGNVATPLAYVAAFLTGIALRSLGSSGPSRDGEPLRPTGVVVAGTLTVGFVVIATSLAILRERTAETLGMNLRAQLWQLFSFNAADLAGELQAALIVASGPLLLFATKAALPSAATRRRVVRAFIFGATVSVVAPIVQISAFNPWLRPDQGGRPSTGLLGLFQDPHSFAAYLTLMVGLVFACYMNARREGRRLPAIAYLLLAVAIVAMLVGTNSRAGLFSLILVGLCLLATRDTERAKSGYARMPFVAAGLLGLLLAGVALVLSTTTLRQATHDSLQELGADRLAQPFADDADWDSILGYRRLRWAAALDVIARRPIWGAGPRSIEKIPIGESHDRLTGRIDPIPRENAHNYFLQFAAEYGVPAAMALIWLLVGVVSGTSRAALHDPSPGSRTLLSGILSAQVGFLAFSVFAHPMLLAECQAIFWTLCGLALSLVRADS